MSSDHPSRPFIRSAQKIKLHARLWTKKNGASVFIIAGILVLWEFIARFLTPGGDLYFAGIEYTVLETLEFQSEVIEGFRITLLEVVAGFTLAVTIGLVIGIVFAELYVIRQSCLPTLVYLYSIPHAIVAPLFIIWFGNGIASIAAFVAWFGFFPVLIGTITGFNHVNEELLLLGEVTGASRWQLIRHIKLYDALPNIVGGIKIAIQQSIVGAIIAEFIATGGGLGYLVMYSQRLIRPGLMFGSLILIMVFSMVLYNLVTWGIDYWGPGPAK